jgi:hypothetical protein
MKVKKTLSERVLAANRANATKSTGPKTVTGKKNSKLNAKSHGLFARELHVREGEEREFETLKEDIVSQLVPQTALQRLAVDAIISCAWRTKLAARLESGQFSANSGQTASQGQTELSRGVAAGWYYATRGNLQAGIRFLSRFREDVANNGRVREFFKDDLVAHFGPYFYDQLAEWLPVNVDLIGFTTQMYNHSQTYNIPLPDKIRPVVVDIRARLQMVLKLIDQEARHLQDLDESFEKRIALSREGATDFAPKFFTASTRDLHRAVDWYARLKDQRM